MEYKQRGNQELIDFLKGFSILSIVLYHLLSIYMVSLPGIIKTAANLGSSGVLIFFFCSGFGLYYSHLNKPLSYGHFIKKRFSRIYIPYIIVVLVSAMFPFMYDKPDKLSALFSHIFLYKMFFNNLIDSYGGQLWFISTIIQFYCIFYILIMFKERAGSKWFAVICTALSMIWVVLLAFIGKENSTVLIRFFLKYLFEFAIGMVLAEKCYHEGTDLNLNVGNIKLLFIGILGIGILGVSSTAGKVGMLLNDIPAFLGFGAIAVLIYNLKIKYINRLLINLNKFSYEWYLIHMLIFSIFFRFSNRSLWMDIMIGFTALAVSLFISFLFHQAISIVYKLKLKKEAVINS